MTLGSLVWWPGVLPAGWRETAVRMANSSRREHSRERQGLINTLNHLCFDLNPGSYSGAESGELKTYFVKAPLADAAVKQGSPR